MKKGEKKVYQYYPELIRFFKYKQDAYTYSIRSEKKIWVKCPDCGYEHQMIVRNLTKRHYNCPICGEKNSYPERLMLAILESLNVEYIYHLNKKTFGWCGKYIYDFYLPNQNIILETDGSQHYSTKFGYNNSKTVLEEQENDRIKTSLAKSNGIKDVIHIDFSDRDLLSIKTIVEPILKNIFGEIQISWNECVKRASSSNMVEICKTWEKYKDTKTTIDLAKMFGISRGQIVRILHRGTDAGLCIYDGTLERKRAGLSGNQKIKQIRTKKIDVYDKDNNFIGTFNGAKELTKISLEKFGVNFTYVGIMDVCHNRCKSHRGYIFKYTNNDKN